MHDGITLEQHGIPTAVICTKPFLTSAKMMAKIQGLEDYPFILVEHPIGSLTDELLNERVIQSVKEIEDILTG